MKHTRKIPQKRQHLIKDPNTNANGEVNVAFRGSEYDFIRTSLPDAEVAVSLKKTSVMNNT